MRAQQHTPPPTSSSDPRSIEIKLTIPNAARLASVSKHMLEQAANVRHRKRLLSVAVVFGVISVVGVYQLFRTIGAPTGDTSTVSAVLTKGNPDYNTLLPTGKTADDYGGWTRISPPKSNPVYAYADKIGSISISVSQQPLPHSFRSNPEKQTEALALDYLATEKVTSSDTTASIGTSAEGQQSVIFHRDNLLIMIKSSAPLSGDQWAHYISQLQ